MKNVSVWSENLKKNNNILNMNITTDILIIGGGLAGILTAYFLNNSSYKVTLVERNQIGSGITSKMTGKVTILQDILTKMNTKNQLDYLKSQIEALSILKNIITTNDIKCHFKKNDSYLYTTKKTNIKKINAIKKVLTELNVIYEEYARKLYRKWDNIKHINDTIKSKPRARKKMGAGFWGLSIKTKERLKSTHDKGTPFGVVITLKEMNGVNRIDDFMKLCMVRGWIVNKIEVNNMVNVYNRAEEEVKFE